MDGGLALSEIIKYPEPLSPTKYYYFNSWTLLHQFSEVFLRFGFSTQSVSKIILFLSILSYALSAFLISYKLTEDKYLSLSVSVLMIIFQKNFGDTDYPSLVISIHTYGMFSLAISSLILALTLNENYKSAGFFSILLISLHPIIGVWILGILIFGTLILKDKKINIDLLKGAILGSFLTVLSFVLFTNNTIEKLDFNPEIFKMYIDLWDGHRNPLGHIHYEYLLKTIFLFLVVNIYFLLLKDKSKKFFLIIFNSSIIFSLILYFLYKLVPELFPAFIVNIMPTRFLILHSFIGWPLIIGALWATFSQFNSTKKFIKIFIFTILIIYSLQHYKSFIKIKNGIFFDSSEFSKFNGTDIFYEISNLELDGYFITTSTTGNYTHSYAFKPILLDVGNFNYIPYHPYLANKSFEILESIYDIDIKNPPIKHYNRIPDSFIKTVFENKTKTEWENIRKKFNANYVVVPSEWEIGLKLFKKNDIFSIYKIE
mgnify:FL=1